MHKENLYRFIEAQMEGYKIALEEVKTGRKKSHWMWYIFPQINGLGFSEMSKKYNIKGIREAEAFLLHPILGPRLVAISNELLKLNSSNAKEIFGSPDDMKLCSCMTLFACVPATDTVFGKVLAKYFNGIKDPQTLALLN